MELPYRYTDEDAELEVSATEISLYEESEPRASRINAPTGPDAVDLARAVLDAAGNTGHEVVDSAELADTDRELRIARQQVTDLRDKVRELEGAVHDLRERAADLVETSGDATGLEAIAHRVRNLPLTTTNA